MLKYQVDGWGWGVFRLQALRAFNINTPKQVEIPSWWVFQHAWAYLGQNP